nr:hypothetical protein [Tanacetum cinerariifolium]
TPPVVPVRTTSRKDQDLITIEDASNVILMKVKDVESMGNMYAICKNAAKSPYPSFKLDERMIWVEISGMPLRAWGSNAFKKGRMCIATKSHKHISEKVLVEVHGEHFEVHVHEISTWSVNIFDNSRDTSSNIDVNEVIKEAKVANSVENYSIDDLNDLNENQNNLGHDFKDVENLENAFLV